MDRVYVIDEQGNITTLYSDDLPVAKLGQQKISRASNVEPSPDGNGWLVQLADNPLNGEHAGRVIARNVQRRDEAIRLEVEYINKHILAPAN